MLERFDPSPSEREARTAMCRKIVAMRRALACCLGDSFSPAPCLDMLLDLYVSQSEGQVIYVWSLCMATTTPFSTAHRKVADLERQGLVALSPEAADRRRIGVQMTAKGESVVAALVASFEAILA